MLSNGSKEVEFRIEVDVVGRKYSVTPPNCWSSRAAPPACSRPRPRRRAAAPAKKGRKPRD
jgi:hypothetical protein